MSDDVELRCMWCKRVYRGPSSEASHQARRLDFWWSECRFCREEKAPTPVADLEFSEPPTADQEFPYA